jgi:hypothetical protein
MDRITLWSAFWLIASRHHTGQNSKGYAKLPQLLRMGYRPGLASFENRRGSEERQSRLSFYGGAGVRLGWSGEPLRSRHPEGSGRSIVRGKMPKYGF